MENKYLIELISIIEEHLKSKDTDSTLTLLSSLKKRASAVYGGDPDWTD